MSEEKNIQSPVSNTGNKKGKAIGYKLIITVLVAIIIILLWLLNTSKQLVREAKDTMEEVRTELTGELDSLMIEHNQVKAEYGELAKKMTKKDSLIEAQSAEIKKLLAKTHDYRRIKKKLAYLRSITQSYVDQLDSLYTVNAQLQKEVNTYKTSLSQEKQKTTTLTKEIEEKNNIITTAASMIPAYNVVGKTYHLRGRKMKEVETVKARRVDRVKICFTLGANLVAQPGKRTVYVRIARPDKLIISRRGDQYSFEANGVRLQYSLKKEVDYQNKAMDVCMQWDKHTDNPAMKGKYDITVWMDGKQIGSSSFTLE